MIPFRRLAQRLHVCLLGLASGTLLAAAPPKIERLEPASLQPGRTNLLTLIGKDLGSLDHAWMLDDFVCDILPATSDAEGDRQRTLSIVVPADAPVGATALRVMSPGGVSDVHVMWVDDLPGQTVRGRPHSPEAAQEIVPPVALEGRLASLHSDFFRFHARAGQVLSLEAWAARIGSETDPLVRLLTLSGREVFYMDDAPARSGELRSGIGSRPRAIISWSCATRRIAAAGPAPIA